jgi:hypothetical protein
MPRKKAEAVAADSASPVAQAKNTPVFAPPKELSTADLPVGQAPEADFEHRSEIILPVDKPLQNDYLAGLAFGEEPITIRIDPSDQENSPRVVDCWVNGKGAEVMDPATGKWLELNCLPIGGVIITKRKYVEVLARSKVDRVATRQETPNPQENQDGYKLQRSTHRKAVFSVIHDPNPKGAAWLTQIMAER